LEEAIADLREREGTTARNIGYICRRPAFISCRDQASGEAIDAWATAAAIDAVIWTDLPSNFEERTGLPFSIDAAIEYLKKLDRSGKAAALYIRSAPSFVVTPLRAALAAQEWFAAEPETNALTRGGRS
jgi:hypothetical protein